MEEDKLKQTQASISQSVDNLIPKVKKGSKKTILIVIAVLLLAAVGTAIYFFTQHSTLKSQNNQALVTTPTTPTPNSNQAVNWKTYTNEKYNYSIQYPDNWSLREFTDSRGGAAFSPLNSNTSVGSEPITINVGQKNGSNINDPFEDYVKIAASKEIQNYNKLASLKKITTIGNTVGYETTWMVQPISRGGPPDGVDSESSPITYFEIPNNKNLLIRVSLGNKENLDIYEKMLTTFTIIPGNTPTPTTTADEESLLKTVIGKYIALKHGGVASSYTITVSKIDGNYAKGMVNDEGGGGMWFAAKEDGLWKLVWDGNGVILCSDLSLYPDFSTSMIPECYNNTTEQLIKR